MHFHSPYFRIVLVIFCARCIIMRLNKKGKNTNDSLILTNYTHFSVGRYYCSLHTKS